MKTKISFLLLLSIILFEPIKAQWTDPFIALDDYGNSSTNLPPAFAWRSIGIGDFNGVGAHPLAALHINQFYLLPSPSFGISELFRTDGINTSINEWTMYSGPNTNTFMYGRLLVDPRLVGGSSANPQDFILNATDPAGNLEFWTAGATNYSTNMEMIILGNAGVTNGYVGIGKGFATPNYHLDIVGNYIGDGVNVSDPAALVHNAVGYSIGGGGAAAPQIFAWHSGDITSSVPAKLCNTNVTAKLPLVHA